MAHDEASPTEAYYDRAWRVKLSRPEYSTLDRRWRSRWDFVVEHADEEAKVLDIGCGDGILGAQLIRKRQCEVTGVDVSDFALEKSRQAGLVVAKCDVSLSLLPFENELFDVVVLSCVLEHIAHPEHALIEGSRVLRKGGQLFVTIPNPLTWRIRLAFLRGKLHSDLLHSKPGEGLHYRFWEPKEGLEKSVAEVGVPLELSYKQIDVKNPKLYSTNSLRIRRMLIGLWPSVFGEYLHYIYMKRTV